MPNARDEYDYGYFADEQIYDAQREMDDYEERYLEMMMDDDGQPDEYTEWQDVYGGDDWDHGQYDMGDY